MKNLISSIAERWKWRSHQNKLQDLLDYQDFLKKELEINKRMIQRAERDQIKRMRLI